MKTTEPAKMTETIKVIDRNGVETEEISLNAELFYARINRRLLDLVLTAYAGNQRRGTASTKTRRSIRGGGKKPWKQKGTGNARQGSIRAPQWRGGGTVFGPQPRSFYTRIPEQMRKQALISALSEKVKNKQLVVLSDLKLDKPKTKELCSVIRNIPLNGNRSLFLAVKPDENLKRASRNIHDFFKIENARDVNAYEILRRKMLIIEKEALPVLANRILEKTS